MSESFDIKVSGDALEVIPRIKDTRGLAQALADTLDHQNEKTVHWIYQRYLSFPSDGPTVVGGLRAISGRLRGSIRRAPVTFSGSSIVSAIGSNVVYAAPQEFGVDEEVTVTPHARQHFSTRTVFGRRRKLRGADTHVGSFKRHMVLPEVGYVRGGIRDRLPEYGRALGTAVINFWTKENS